MSGARSWWAGQICDCVKLTENTTTQQPGAAIQISATGAGTVILTLLSGATITVNVQVGDSIYPYQVTKATAGTATGLTYYNLIA